MRKPGGYKSFLAVSMLICVLCCLVLAALSLSQGYAKSGIATIKLDLSQQLQEILPRQAPKVPKIPKIPKVPKVPKPPGNIDAVTSRVADTVKTAIPESVSRVRSVADAVATQVSKAIPGIPQVFYVGTRYMCVGDLADKFCHRLPVHISDVIPSEGLKVLNTAFGDSKFLNDRGLSFMTVPHIMNCFIAGIVLIIGAFTFFVSVLKGWCSCMMSMIMPFRLFQSGLHLLLGLVCCLPFMLAVGFQMALRSALPAWVDLEQGGIFGLSVGCLCCGCALGLLGGALPFFT